MKDLTTRIAAASGLLLIGVATAAAGGWGVLALVYDGPEDVPMRIVLAALFANATVLSIVALCLRRWRWRGLIAYVALFAVLLWWWRGIELYDDEDWKEDVKSTSAARSIAQSPCAAPATTASAARRIAGLRCAAWRESGSERAKWNTAFAPR